MSKLVGGGLHNCAIVRGMVLKGDAVGSIKHMEKAKVQIIFLSFHFSLIKFYKSCSIMVNWPT